MPDHHWSDLLSLQSVMEASLPLPLPSRHKLHGWLCARVVRQEKGRAARAAGRFFLLVSSAAVVRNGRLRDFARLLDRLALA